MKNYIEEPWSPPLRLVRYGQRQAFCLTAAAETAIF